MNRTIIKVNAFVKEITGEIYIPSIELNLFTKRSYFDLIISHDYKSIKTKQIRHNIDHYSFQIDLIGIVWYFTTKIACHLFF